MRDPLAGLDPDQRAAAEQIDGAVLILAGPGTGKTRTLTHRIAHLIADRGAPPEACLAITFTRRAAGELRERLQRLLPEEGARVPVHTFHSLGLAVLREGWREAGLPEAFQIADPDTQRQVLAEALDLSAHKAGQLRDKISAHKVAALTEEDPALAAAARRYDEAMRARALVDFDDLVVLAAALLERDVALRARWQDRCRWVHVDEVQDMDPAQYRLLRALVQSDGRLCAIGDPDQAIYGFRGADVALLQRFAGDYPGLRTLRLGSSYRLGQHILGASAQMLSDDASTEARLRSLLDRPGAVVLHQAASELAEAEFVVQGIEQLVGGHSFFSLDTGRSGGDAAELGFGDIAVLYRTEAQADPLVEALERSGLPYQRRSHRRLMSGDAAALIADAAGDPQGQRDALALGCDVDLWDPRAARVSLLTLHAAKGLEFAAVFVVGCEDGLLPLRFDDRCDLAEERRLLYVGMTRASARLYLCHARKRRWRGKVREQQPSPFLTAIAEQLLERSETRARARRPADKQLTLFS